MIMMRSLAKQPRDKLHKMELKNYNFIPDNMAFICRMDEHRDAINFGKCVDLGVPTALISELQTKPLNESVELPDGRLITLSDIVCGPIDSEKSFAGKYNAKICAEDQLETKLYVFVH